ncbi:hypothetical protein DV738_g3947, partial [Chaetothyriales sp. CBS 135597]
MSIADEPDQSTRVFISGLPSKLTNHQLRAHFAQKFDVTDAHVFPDRRIAFVGLNSHEAAKQAVAFFNRSFIRMSKISVELAKPFDLRKDGTGQATPISNRSKRPDRDNDHTKKRKREVKDDGEDVRGHSVQADTEPSVAPAGNPQRPGASGSDLGTSDLLEANEDEDERPSDEAPLEPKDDSDWLRGKTSRVLDLLDASDVAAADTTSKQGVPAAETVTLEDEDNPVQQPEQQASANPESTAPEVANGRLFVRNLPFSTSEDDLSTLFTPYGKIEEVHVVKDKRTGTSRGTAFVQFFHAADASQALTEVDGRPFQGRLIHILPASDKKDTKLNDYEISQLPIKKQKALKRKAEASSASFSWNSLYMNPDAVMASVANRLGVSKSDILDPASTDAAVKQALAETSIIKDTKEYLQRQGINIEAFKNRARDERSLLLKNFPFGTTTDELSSMLSPFGTVERIIFPPTGTIAIALFGDPLACKAALKGLAYKNFKGSVLYLEKAPLGLFDTPQTEQIGNEGTEEMDPGANTEVSSSSRPTATVFVRGLNFATTSARLSEVFSVLSGFRSARVKTRTDSSRPNEVLSMGFGFVEFASSEQAEAAIATMNNRLLDGHVISVQRSQKSLDAAEERRKEDGAKKSDMQKTKLVIKNLPFETSKKDIKTLLGSYGTLRSLRMPKKMDNTPRGFAFADFATAKEARNAIEALSSTHLLGRRLVIDYAEEDVDDPEETIKAMEKKAGRQEYLRDAERLQRGAARKKFVVNDGNEDDQDATSLLLAHQQAPSLTQMSPDLLGSNDQHAQNDARLQARRQYQRARLSKRIRTDPNRPYLQHPKYLQYRARQRCDTGPDGKPVWDDRIEDAFQNALVNIEPMGRRKKSQRGRPHGRNELISEWILRETGEYRSRKQVSSHIQVLNSLLKGIPEWDALTTPDEKTPTGRASHKYYSSSSQRVGRDQRTGSEASTYGYNDTSKSSPSYKCNSEGGFPDDHRVGRLSFAMWVSLPGQMDQALHTYTRVQSSDSTPAPIALSNVTNWRTLFPSFSHIIDTNWTSAEQCDVILLDASIELMDDFPPKFSNLGIALELDFRHPSNSNGGSLANLTRWTCVTQIFQNGQLNQRFSRLECQVAEVGKVKPFFESKWWAAVFTQLTEKRKRAESLRGNSDPSAGNKTTKNFFRGLTVTQEISAEVIDSTLSSDGYTTQSRPKKRMAILLWKFSEAPSGFFVGVTTWQKVMVQTELKSADSTAHADLSLVPTSLETGVSSGPDDSLFKAGDESFLSGSAVQQYNAAFDVNLPVGDDFSQDEFISYRPDDISSCFELPQSSFDITATSSGLDPSINLAASMSQQGVPRCQDEPISTTTNYFEFHSEAGAESQPGLHVAQHSRQNSFHSQQDTTSEFEMETYHGLPSELDDDKWGFQIPALEPRMALSLPPPSIPHSPGDFEDEAVHAALLGSPFPGLSSIHSAPESRSQTVAPAYSSITSAPSKTTVDSCVAPDLFASPPLSSPGPRIARQRLQSHPSSYSFPSYWSGDGPLPYRPPQNTPSNKCGRVALAGHVDLHHTVQNPREDFESFLAHRLGYGAEGTNSSASVPDNPRCLSRPVGLAYPPGNGNNIIHGSLAPGLRARLYLQHLTDEVRRPHSQPALPASATEAPAAEEDLAGWLRACWKAEQELGQQQTLRLDQANNIQSRPGSVVSDGRSGAGSECAQGTASTHDRK